MPVGLIWLWECQFRTSALPDKAEAQRLCDLHRATEEVKGA